jgi:3-oxoadipate enol-lactonase
MGSTPEETLAAVRASSPQLYETVVDGAFGGPLARPELTRRDREMATVAVLAALGAADPQLRTHATAALGNDVAPSELLALCEHVAVHAGFPRALNALHQIDQALGDAGVPPPPLLHHIQLRDHETVVAQSGQEGPAVLLSHALGLDWRMWQPVIARLAQGRCVYAYDIRGHGSASGSPRPFSLDDAAADLIGVLDAVGVEQAHVVGLSYGGGITQTAALRNPERFASMALLATTDYPFEAFEGRARSAEADGMEAQVVPSLTRWFTPAGLALNGWGVRYARERVQRGQVSDWAAAWRSFKGLDVQGWLAGVEIRTLVLAGELDASCTPEIMGPIAERIPGALYEELPGTPHMQTLERPELVAQALDRFLPTSLPDRRGHR